MDSTNVLNHFRQITRIPRESGHEEAMTAYLQQFASLHGFECKTDALGNVNIIKPAAPGKENVPTIVLQSHQDMVCEKLSGFAHDFAKDPIPFEIEDGWMIARNTTLGADDGIGIAASLALLESDLPTGRLECVFTISEETGMDGAFGMEPGFFTGKTLINLDSEDEGQLFIGCSGGLDTFATFHYENEPLRDGYKVLKVQLNNAIGGHSGDDINKDRLNAVQQMARFLFRESHRGLQLIRLTGGNKPNAIAREAEAVIAVPNPGQTVARLQEFAADIHAEFHVTDPDVRFYAEACEAPGQPMESGVASRLVRALLGCPHGVSAMSQDIPGLVETSSNLAAVKMDEPGKVLVITSQRSSIPSARKFVSRQVRAVFMLAGAEVEHLLEYPGWTPNPDSPILHLCIESYRRLFHTDPEVKAIHAGLECGLFGEKFGQLDMISFGPTLRGVHAPGEKLELASLDKFWDLLVDVVTNFK